MRDAVIIVMRDPEQATNTSGVLEGAAKVQAPDVSANQFAGLGVHFRNQVPAIVGESGVADDLPVVPHDYNT